MDIPTPLDPIDWANTPLVGFDTETTGVNVFTDRIVTASIYTSHDDQSANVLINPGVEIPEFASAIHGITTEHARQHGQEPPAVLDWLRNTLHTAWQSGTPVVGHNVVYDLSILAAELRRYGLQPLQVTGPVFDTLVLDKHVDKWRKGKRRLDVVAEVYNVGLDAAHTADADAKAACLIGQAIVAKHFPDVSAMALTEAQKGWAAEQADSLQGYFRRIGNSAVVDGRWPLYDTPLVTAE